MPVHNAEIAALLNHLVDLLEVEDANPFRVRAYRNAARNVETCILCPYMKEIRFDDVLKALKEPAPEQYIEIPPAIAARAKRSLERMFELEKEGKALLAKQGRNALPWTA